MAETLPQKLYFRIGEVAGIVGVEPHVLRYWEREFRSIRPTKSARGQRVYSRRDVEKLLRVKDLLKNQGFTIAGARKRLSEPAAAGVSEPAPSASEPAAGASEPAEPVDPDPGAKNMRKVLLGLRHELMNMLEEISAPKGR